VCPRLSVVMWGVCRDDMSFPPTHSLSVSVEPPYTGCKSYRLSLQSTTAVVSLLACLRRCVWLGSYHERLESPRNSTFSLAEAVCPSRAPVSSHCRLHHVPLASYRPRNAHKVVRKVISLLPPQTKHLLSQRPQTSPSHGCRTAATPAGQRPDPHRA
jgi:hypothetical protein